MRSTASYRQVGDGATGCPPDEGVLEIVGFRAMSAPNGWGTYEQVVPFLAALAADCLIHPEALVEVSL